MRKPCSSPMPSRATARPRSTCRAGSCRSSRHAGRADLPGPRGRRALDRRRGRRSRTRSGPSAGRAASPPGCGRPAPAEPAVYHRRRSRCGMRRSRRAWRTGGEELAAAAAHRRPGRGRGGGERRPRVIATPAEPARVAASLQKRGLPAEDAASWQETAPGKVAVLLANARTGLRAPGLLLLPIGPLLRPRARRRCNSATKRRGSAKRSSISSTAFAG